MIAFTHFKKIFCVAFFAMAGVADATDEGGRSSSEKSTVAAAKTDAKLDDMIWQKMLKSRSIEGLERAKTLVQIYKAFEKGSYRAETESTLYLSTAVFHSFEKGLRYAALPLVKGALLRKPSLVADKRIVNVWNILAENFSKRASPRDEVTLVGLAALLDGPVLAASKDSRFAYYKGISLFARQKYEESLSVLASVGVDSHDYRRAKFSEGGNLVALGKTLEAVSAFQVVTSMDRTAAENDAGIGHEEVAFAREKAVLQLARIFYEAGRFEESLAYYRTLRQESPLFYESLSEQGWAFFMAGFPNRAMGAVYAAETPFFAHLFNPDIHFLDAAISYWLCDFGAANAKIAKFVKHTRNDGDSLRSLVLRFGNYGELEQLDKYARIAEDVQKGVSPQNIGLGKKVLATLVRSVGVGDYLEDLELLRDERLRFKTDKRYPQGKDRLDYALGEFEKIHRAAIGAQVKNRLHAMAQVMDKSLARLRLLHLEVLTAKKDNLVGKERTVQGNEFLAQEQEFVDEGQDVARNWRQDKSEYWFDELGHYVFREKSKCTSAGITPN
jgi:tetratricopeptide (TPR) repeat protein